MSQDEIDEIRAEGADDDEQMPDIAYMNAAKKVKMALGFLNSPSDLVPGVYEGGLKTWECSLDLAAYLCEAGRGRMGQRSWVRGKSVLEVRATTTRT